MNALNVPTTKSFSKYDTLTHHYSLFSSDEASFISVNIFVILILVGACTEYVYIVNKTEKPVKVLSIFIIDHPK